MPQFEEYSGATIISRLLPRNEEIKMLLDGDKIFGVTVIQNDKTYFKRFFDEI